ncbi:MAG: family 16 glycosylhydrolase [Bacteroidales bacterium]|nr:family 16 glycosylhydrolase [Bacteroidales bacterium]
MNRTRIAFFLFFSVVILLSFLACDNQKKGRTGSNNGSDKEIIEILVEAENFSASHGDLAITTLDSGDTIVKTASGGWLAFDVEIPVAGRYISQIKIASQGDDTSSCWIEDYYDNKDGRTYNITGNIPFSGTGPDEEWNTLTRDGSPLNSGLHKIKLHFDNGDLKIDWIKFTLLKEHRITPEFLVQNTSGDNWVLVWSDEFEGEGIPDTTKWLFDIGDWGWGNNERQYYTEDRPENARLENGNLVIEARKNDLGHEWTSARLTTRGKVSFVYGKIEFRAKVPPNRGNWAAGWTLGDAYVDEISWPYCGEIDILESVGFEMDDASGNGKAHASIHCGAYYFKLGNQPTGIIDVKNMHEEFHTYTLEWMPDEIKAFVDGQKYFTYSDTSSDLSWPYDKPQNIILNLAMGGGWGGAQGMDEDMTSQQFIIDYVRVYELQ